MEITAAEFFNQDFEKYMARMEKELSKKEKITNFNKNPKEEKK